MAPLDPTPENDLRRPGQTGDTVPKPSTPIAAPRKVDLHISLERIPGPLAAAVENLAKPERPASPWKTLFKDYLPVLTPAAAVIVSFVVFYYTNEFNERAQLGASADALTKLIDELATPEEAPKEPQDNDKVQEQLSREERHRTILAMKVAIYGDRAIPAVRMALGADDAYLRNGGVLVAEQMDRAGTVDHGKLTGLMLNSYDDPSLRRGILEWFTKVNRHLSGREGRIFLGKLKQQFGVDGKDCVAQNELALGAATFLYYWSLQDPKDMTLDRDSAQLAMGMATNCTESTAARAQALEILPTIASRLMKQERASLRNELQTLRSRTPPGELNNKIGMTETDISSE